jgi:hypothetical protein
VMGCTLYRLNQDVGWDCKRYINKK